jgi:hypothetical protein
MVEENISFFIDDNTEQNNDDFIFNLNELLNTEYVFKDNDNLYTKLIYYDINYTIKQLFVICVYYGIAKHLRITKCNKSDILNTLIIYENNIENIEKVNKRKQLWHYINELKNDKFMKKYILWN